MNRLIFLLLLTFPATAFADTMAGLQLNFASGTDASVKTDISAVVPQSVSGHSRFTFQSFAKARGKLNPVVKDCFTDDCLKKAGGATGADFGLRVRFSGEAQIYDWSIDTFDLRTGKTAKSLKGSCELCGRAEVVRTFKTTMKEALDGTKKRSSSKSNPVVKRDPVKKDPVKKDPVEPITEPNPDPYDSNDRVLVTEVFVNVEPTDATIMMDGQEVGRGQTTLTLSPGSYELQFKREGYKGFVEQLVIGEATGTRTQVRIHMSKTDPEAVMVRSGEGAIDRLDNRALWGGIALGTGGALLITGIVLTNIDGEPTCSDGDFQDCPDVYATGLGGIVLTTTGAILATAGTGLLLWNFLAGEPEEGDVTMAPAVGQGYGGISISGSF